MAILEKLRENAKSKKRRIVLPEGWDERTIKAASELINNDLTDVTILGDEHYISDALRKTGIHAMPEIIDTASDNGYFSSFVETYCDLRQRKGKEISFDEAVSAMKNPLFFGAMMVHCGIADGCVAGAASTSSDVLRASLRVIGTAEGVKTVSSFMIMETKLHEYGEDGTLFFADIAVKIAPNPEELADIAITTSDSWKKFMGTEPKTAFLSFATKGSAEDSSVDKIREALKIAKNKRPDINMDGELQLDAALISSVGERKAPESTVAGKANVLIFPDLNAANIGYKLVERFSQNASATGPVLQGLAKPINDLSRGAGYMDIVNTVLVTIFQAGDRK